MSLQHCSEIFRTARFTPEEACLKVNSNNPGAKRMAVSLSPAESIKAWNDYRTIHDTSHKYTLSYSTHAHIRLPLTPAVRHHLVTSILQATYARPSTPTATCTTRPVCPVMSIIAFNICTARSHHVISLKYCFDKYVDSSRNQSYDDVRFGMSCYHR